MKRKRKIKGEKEKKHRHEPPRGRLNPFLFSEATTETRGNNHSQEDVLQQVLAFVHATDKRRHDEKDKSIDETVKALLSYLGKACDAPASSSSLISHLDVATMLLPWATKHLLHLASGRDANVESEDDIQTLYWQSIVTCLETLVPDQTVAGGSKSGEVASILTQSALNKLVPFVADMVLSSGDSETRDVCAKGYAQFTDLYHPTLDLACNSLLVSVHDKLSSNTSKTPDAACILLPFAAHGQVIYSTLKLLRTLQRQGAANPKKTFLLLSSPPVLTALSDFYFATAVNNNFVLKDSQELVRELLWHGLFSPSNHMEGFYSMRLYKPLMRLPPRFIPEACTKAKVQHEGADEVTEKNTSKQIHSYQDNLLSAMQELLYPLSGEMEANQSSDRVIAAAHLAPLLLEGLILQSASWEKNRSSSSHHGKRLAGDEIAGLQFRFWSNSMGTPMVSYLTDTTKDGALEQRSTEFVIVLRSLRKSLELLLKHDVYLPSYEDSENQHFLFLEWVAMCALKSVPDESSVVNHAEIKATKERLCILEALFRLNHLLLHDRLSQVITFAIASTSRLENKRESPTFRYMCQLISTLVEVYDKLRQLEHFFKAILATVDDLEKESESGTSILRLLNMVIHEGDVTSKLSSAIRRCPHGQIHTLFETFNAWMAETTKQPAHHEEKDAPYPRSENSSDESLPVVTNLFILVTRNVRVDNHTAIDIDRLCHECLRVSVVPLLASRDAQSSTLPPDVFLKQGLFICGWLIDLQTRCDFWLGRNEVRRDGAELERSSDLDSVWSILHTAIDSIACADSAIVVAESKGGNVYYPVLGELQFLACYRIQQLHSQIHEKQLVEPVDQNAKDERALLASEARKMVDFAVRVAGEGMGDTRSWLGGEGRSRWAILAQTIATWTPYAESKHIESFLRWIFFVFASAEVEGAQSTTEEPIQVFPFGESVVSDVFREDRTIVMSLLRDASFFEIGEISAQIREIGFACAGELVRHAVVGSDANSRLMYAELDLLCPASSSSRTPLHPKALVGILNASAKATSLSSRMVRLNDLLQGLRILMLLNGLPEQVAESVTDNRVQLDTALRLDVVMRLLVSHCTPSESEIQHAAVQVMCATRSAAARELQRMSGNTTWPVLLDGNCLTNLITGLCQSAALVLEGEIVEAENLRRRLLLSTGKFIDALFSKCLAAHEDDSGPALVFASCMENLLSSSVEMQNDTTKRVLVNVLRPIAKRMVLVKKRSGQSTNEPGGGADLIERVVKSIYKYLWIHLVRDTETNLLSVGATIDPMLAESVVLLGDTIRLLTIDESDFGTEAKSSRDISGHVGTICKALVKFLLEGAEVESARVFERAAIYFLACTLSGDTNLVEFASSSDFAEGMLKVVQSRFLSSGERPDQMMDAVISGIVTRMETKKFQDFLGHLLRFPPTFQREAGACSVHLFTIVLLCVKSSDHRQEVSRVAREFLFLSLELLSQPTDAEKMPWKTSVDVATCSISTLMENKDIVTLRERDIARILSSVSSTIGTKKSGLQQNAKDLDSAMFSSCSSLVALLLQRFPKQMYACAPSLTSVMHSLLLRVISDSVNEVERAARAQQFTRLCELLASHKDVFKKHVLGLILEFVRALRDDLGPTVKKNLLPAIYQLLDMLTLFETKQLNALMDATGKALFRSVFQSYQKLHMYKGQY